MSGYQYDPSVGEPSGPREAYIKRVHDRLREAGEERAAVKLRKAGGPAMQERVAQDLEADHLDDETSANGYGDGLAASTVASAGATGASLDGEAGGGPVLRVEGVALGADEVTEGASGRTTQWPAAVLREAAPALVGTKFVDDSAHGVDTNADVTDVPSRPPSRTIVGEVTSAAFEPGVGVTFEGELADPRLARAVEAGRLEVSPFVFARYDEQADGTHRAEEIGHWRDLALVEQGASEAAEIRPAGT